MTSVQKKFKESQSTFATTNYVSRGTDFFRFKTRGNKRLKSTLDNWSAKSKFHPVRSQTSIQWRKWRINEIKTDFAKFQCNLKRQAIKQLGRQDQSKWDQIKLCNKIYEVQKLKTDIKKARQNNQLIRNIQKIREKRINDFFDSLQKKLNS